MNRCAVLVLALVGAMALCGRAGAQCSAQPNADWSNTMSYVLADFAVSPSYSTDEPRWVKFTILLCDPTKVYFQDGRVHPFHHGFASQRLNPFIGWTASAFNAATLHASGQQAVLGAVLWPGFDPWSGQEPPPREMAIQLVRQDAYSREQVRDWFNLVKSKITDAQGVRFLYMPTFEQQPSAETHRAWLESEGIEVSSVSRWVRGTRTYAPGWALGTLKYVPGSQVASAYTSGALRPEDVLLTEGVPADLPPLAGIVSLSPATPNSHVAILSQTWGVPFVYLAGEEGVAAQAMVGRRVLVRTRTEYGVVKADIADVQDALTQTQVGELLALKAIAPLDYDPVQLLGIYSKPTGALTSADTKNVGGKAANYGLLRRAIPNNSRVAAALTLDLWNEYLSQTLLNGRTLRQEIHLRLDQHTWPPANPSAQSVALAGVRALFTDTSQTAFTPAQQSAVLATLADPQYGFDDDIKIRFRSSTNVEDTATFTGAGLYDSFSGCLHDDTDADSSGPSWCDGSETNERGVFRAIRKVFASFYNDNAWQARRRLGVIEDEVGMAMLVHHSFPDATEMANGVAVLKKQGSLTTVSIVSQVGATSVANPEDGSISEEVEVSIYSFGTYPEIVRSSNRVIVGGTVMTWDSDYRALTSLLVQVANRYALETGKTSYALDFEFKKTAPGGELEIKQVRPLPSAPAGGGTPMLVRRPQQWCVFQGENSDVFALHRLKSRVLISSDSLWLTPANAASSFLSRIDMEHIVDCSSRTLSGRPSEMPGAAHTFAGGVSSDAFRLTGAANPRTYTLEFSQIPSTVAAGQPPTTYMSDFGYPNRHLATLSAQYDQPVTGLHWNDTLILRTSESVQLCPCPKAEGVPVHRVFSHGTVTFDTMFAWVPGGGAGGYTADLASWTRTIITGLTSRPITLTGPFAQTYRPGHHNFYEYFVFDPRLDPSVPRQLRYELARADIGMIYTIAGRDGYNLTTLPDECGLCPLDMNADRLTSIDDLFLYFNAYFMGDSAADWDGVNGVAIDDLFLYINAYFTGC